MPTSPHHKDKSSHTHAWHEAMETLCGIPEGKMPRMWWALFLLCVVLVGGLIYALVCLTSTGVGVLGVDQTVFWGWDIINFVFWIGIGHAGTLISAILLLTRQQWRSSVSRIAEVMTVCAVICAAIFPIFHLGRVWMAWFFFPVPESNGMWQNFLSPLMWDAFAVGTYFSLSCAFLYICMIPDLALMRDRAGVGIRAKFYGLLALGWRGSDAQWKTMRRSCLILAGILTALVISVHSIVSFDFAVTLVPGWQSSLFPPYFVVGAILGGLAMVLLVVIPMRRVFKLQNYISVKHLDALAKLLLGMSLAIGFCYALEFYMALKSGHEAELSVYYERMLGGKAWAFWLMLACNVLVPQCLWLRKARRSLPWLVIIGVFVTVGMWMERFVIIVNTMEKGAFPSMWTDYLPSFVDVLMLTGTFGLFFGGVLLFLRFFPGVGVTELCELRVGKASPKAEIPELPIDITGRYEEKDDFMPAYQARSSGEEAITPFDIKEPGEELRLVEESNPIARGAFMGGVSGMLLSIALTVWTQLVDYPLVLQGKEADLTRFIGFIPVIFESTLLGAGIGVIVLFLKKGRLLRWWHPWFETPEYEEYARTPGFYLRKKDPIDERER